jgi:hypothetical protein
MVKRIALWTFVGYVIASAWVFYSLVPNNALNLFRSNLLAITAPASLLGRSLAMKYYWFVALNAAIYALVGLAIEPLLHLRRPAATNRTFGA